MRCRVITDAAGYGALIDLDHARHLAYELPGVTEEPHFELTSFRVRGKIFATAPADGSELRVFVGEEETQASVAEDPDTFSELWWGKRLSGVRVVLAAAEPQRVAELLDEAWRRRAPKGLIAELDQRR